MRLATAALLLAGLSGCGSSWEWRPPPGIECTDFDECGLRSELPWYVDEDGDGWGVLFSEPVFLADADVAQFLTAENNRDCDDLDAGVTGFIGSVCPSELQPGNDNALGLVFGDSEYAATHGPSVVHTRASMAGQVCSAWGSNRTDDAGVVVEPGSLAVLTAGPELDAVTTAIEDAGVSPGEYAGFIGAEWVGDLGTAAADAWKWIDGDPAAVDQLIDWCGGTPPTPMSFQPDLDPAEADQEESLIEFIPEMRLALVYPPAGGWCLGVPSAATLGGYLDERDAHFVCERPVPDPIHWASTAQPGQQDTAAEPTE